MTTNEFIQQNLKESEKFVRSGDDAYDLYANNDDVFGIADNITVALYEERGGIIGPDNEPLDPGLFEDAMADAIDMIEEYARTPKPRYEE